MKFYLRLLPLIITALFLIQSFSHTVFAASENLWGTTTPAASKADSVRYELGTVFSPTVNGQVTGVRIYAVTNESGTHTVRIWNNSTGTVVKGPNNFSAAGTGWRTYNFSTPLDISAGTSYTVSITTGGDAKRRYAYTENALTQPGNNGVNLTYPANAGVYTTTLGTRPTQSYNSSNYFRDVIFSPSAVPTNTPTPTPTNTPTPTTIPPTATPTPTNTPTPTPTNTPTPIPPTATPTPTDTPTPTPTTVLPTDTPTPTNTPTPTVNPTEYTLWPETVNPSNFAVSDPNSVELGVKFKSSQDGQVLGIRFYKGPQNTGTHTGSLWNSSGTRLATATFTNETSTGWQEVRFSSPAAITANTTYVASYYAPSGYYSADASYFATDYTNNSLTAPSSSSSGGNGVYIYGASAYPNQTYNATNYWVDVVFSTSAIVNTPTPTISTPTPTPDPENSPVKLGINADLGGMKPFTADDPWNQNIEDLPVHPEFARIQSEMDTLNPGWREGRDLRPDFGSGTYNGSPIGIPYIVAPIDQPLVPIINQAYGGDEGPYPMPPNTPIENINDTGYADRHAIVVQRDTTKPNHIGHIFELFRAFPQGDYPNSVTEWWASSYAKFDANSNTLQSRAISQLSTDAAGLPIFPGLVRYDEVQHAIATQGRNGDLGHALRFTVNEYETEWSLIRPATEVAGHNTGPIPFGSRWRLRADYVVSSEWPDELAVIINTLKRYGMLQADNSDYWAITGAPDERWNNAWLSHIRYIKAGDFEMVDTGPIIYKSPGGDPITPTPIPTDTPTPTATPTPIPPTNTPTPTPTNTPTPVVNPTEYTLWPGGTTPSEITVNDPAQVELGVKFKSSQDGQILGIRFYKGPSNTGTHTGSLWNQSGTRLATATFTSETASGWQEVRFSTPVSITANTIYTASYHTDTGYYSANSNYFATDYTNNSLTAPSSSVSGGNGVYGYGASAYPAQTYNATNYWVDVVFSSAGGGADTEPPTTPSGLVAKGVSDRTINLSWTASTDNFGVAGYNIYRDGAKVGSSSGTTYADTGLNAATYFTYTIDAYDSASNTSTQSSSVSASTKETYTVAPPIPPSTYSVPAGAIRVTNSAELLAALNNNTNANIVLADGTYDHTTYFSACDNKLWSENLLGATITAGIEFGGNYCVQGGGAIHGIKFDVATDTKTLQNSIVHAWGSGPGNLTIQDSVFRGNWVVWQGLFLLQVENNVIERNEFYHFLDTGMRVSDTAYVGHIAYGSPVKAINHISDIFVDGAARSVAGGPSVSNGTGEMGLWVGNPVTNGVQRIKVRNASVAGVLPVDNSRDTTFSDLDIDMTGPYVTMGLAVATEHWGHHNIFTKFHLKGARAFHCEWDDPAWGGTPACYDTTIDTGVMDGAGANWDMPSIGVSLDNGTFNTTVRNVRFINQQKAAINLNNVAGTNDFNDNDFTGILPGALPIRYGHPYY